MSKFFDFTSTGVAEHTGTALENYLIHGMAPGGFLLAVLKNNLYDAVSRADSVNSVSLSNIVRWIHSYAPMESYGNSEMIKHWCNNTNDIRKNYVYELKQSSAYRKLISK